MFPSLNLNYLLKVLFIIIDSTEGVPIGQYLSQFFANLYLSYFDHWILEQCKVKFYFRYADDIIILSDNKSFLHNLLIVIKFYFHLILKIEIKQNYKIIDIDKEGIDFVGYKFYHNRILLRKSIKLKIIKTVNKYVNGLIDYDTFNKIMSSYRGWLKYANTKNLCRKIEIQTGYKISNWRGIDDKISKYYNKNVKLIEIVDYSKYFSIHFIYKNNPISVKSTNKKLYLILDNLQKPCNFVIKKL